MKCLYIKARPFDENFIGGVRAHTVGMVNGFVDAGADVRVLCECRLSDIRAEQNCIYHYTTDKEYDKEIYAKTKQFLQTSDEKFDFIYSRFAPTSLSPMKLALEFGIPYVTEYNSSTLTTWKEVRLPEIRKNGNIVKRLAAECISPFRCRGIDKNEMMILHNASLIVTVSDVLREELMNRGISDTKILVCPNGVDPSVFCNHPEGGAAVREELHIPNEAVTIGFASTFGKWHGIPELTQAISQLHQKRDMNYILMGDGMMKSQMEKELSPYEDVHFCGKIPFKEMPDYLSACDILLVVNSWNPSDKRPFFGSPTKMFEYMSMGKAIVASELEQIGAVLRDGVNCFGFLPGDIQGMQDAILRAADNQDLRFIYGQKARMDVIEHYTWRKNAESVIALVHRKNENENRS